MSPSVRLIDSRSVRTSHHIDSSEKGIDGGKKVKGRKEHIIVDMLRLPMAIKVHAAKSCVVIHPNVWMYHNYCKESYHKEDDKRDTIFYFLIGTGRKVSHGFHTKALEYRE